MIGKTNLLHRRNSKLTQIFKLYYGTVIYKRFDIKLHKLVSS